MEKERERGERTDHEGKERGEQSGEGGCGMERGVRIERGEQPGKGEKSQ